MKKIWPKEFADFRLFAIQQNERKNILVLDSEFPEEEFADLKEGDIQVLLGCNASELTWENLEYLTALTKPKDEEETEAGTQGPQLTTSALHRGPSGFLMT